jgi:rare lipoprotein A (peptidoglycan hydrolase)
MNAKHLGAGLLLLIGLSACSGGSSAPYAPTLRIRPPEAPKWAPAKVETGEALASAKPEKPVPVETGLASWYGVPFHGRKTASGEVFDKNKLTAAHPSLPLGTPILITNLETGESIRARVNDRFPGRPGYVIDVSQAIAQELDFEHAGRARVAVKPLKPMENS